MTGPSPFQQTYGCAEVNSATAHPFVGNVSPRRRPRHPHPSELQRRLTDMT
jgi:hypothetical protein